MTTVTSSKELFGEVRIRLAETGSLGFIWVWQISLEMNYPDSKKSGRLGFYKEALVKGLLFGNIQQNVGPAQMDIDLTHQQ